MEEEPVTGARATPTPRAALAEAFRHGGRSAPRGSRSGSTRLRIADPDALPRRPFGTVTRAKTVPAKHVPNVGDARVPAPTSAPAPTESLAELCARLRRLSREADLTRAELIDALLRFDELEGWRAAGARSCAAWAVTELGHCRSLAYLLLQVGRALKALPIIAGLFRGGELSFSKVRALVRVASPEDERALAIMALGVDAETVQRRCDEYRWGRAGDSDADEGMRERARFERRSVRFSRLPDGSVGVHGALPPDMAAALVRCLERAEAALFADADRDSGALPTAAQRRADALVALAEAGAAGGNAPGDGAEADPRNGVRGTRAKSSSAVRDLVVAHVDVQTLEAAAREVAARAPDDAAPLPLPLRAALAGTLGGGIAASTVRRMACDGTLVTAIVEGGEPVSLGRRVRLHNAGQRTAILARDGGCTFPGCGRRTQLEAHHAPGWAAGGVTSVRDSTTLCRACHAKVHDEGWTVVRVADDESMERGASAAALLAGADARTRAVVDRLDARRPRFRFEPPTSASPPASPSSPSSSPSPSSSSPSPSPSSKTCSSKTWPDEIGDVAPGRSAVGHGGGGHDGWCCRDGRGEYRVVGRERRGPEGDSPHGLSPAVHGMDSCPRRSPFAQALAACPACRPSPTSSTSFAQNASRSFGFRLVTSPSSTTTSSSTHVPPAFRTSVRSDG